MEYREDRGPLRDRLTEADQALEEASARADRAERELADARRALNDCEAELRRLRGSPAPARGSRAPLAAVALAGAAFAIGATALLLGRAPHDTRPIPPPPLVAPPPGRVAPPLDPPAEVDHGGPGGGGIVPAGEHLQWGSGFEPSVFPTRIDDDAVEDFVGTYRLLDREQGLYVGGFDGATLQRRWAAGPYGTLSEGAGATHVALAGGRVLVTDFRARAHVLDARTGQELAVVPLSDRARRVCAIPGSPFAPGAPAPDPPAVWVEVADGHHVSVNLATNQAAAAAKPASCVGDFANPTCAFARAACAESAAGAPGAHGEWTLGIGPGAVTVGRRSPGTAIPMAFAAGGKGWQRVLPEDPALAEPSSDVGADLAGGIFVTAYQLVSRGFHLVALDAQSGERRWDVLIPRSAEGSGPRGITATESRVYVPHWTWLDVFELQTGRRVGTVGIW